MLDLLGAAANNPTTVGYTTPAPRTYTSSVPGPPPNSPGYKKIPVFQVWSEFILTVSPIGYGIVLGFQ